jgi:hypothetical protein
MSAFLPLTTVERTSLEVRFVPLPDSCAAAISNNVRCIHVPVEPTAPNTDYTLSSYTRLDEAF